MKEELHLTMWELCNKKKKTVQHLQLLIQASRLSRIKRSVLSQRWANEPEQAGGGTTLTGSSTMFAHPRLVLKRRDFITALPLYYSGDLSKKKKKEKVRAQRENDGKYSADLVNSTY